ncbi:urease subunit beta [Actinomadura chokoriensis]|uniref:Urease subunit beta n=1 Tax=Actinomadura chokoriensis TaxID=454156 RepID=A0ABV4QVP4_9ACTN
MADDLYMFGKGEIELNKGQRRESLTVQNTGDRAIQIGSHYHFFEVNRALSFDREKTIGMRLDIPAGTAVRFEAGDTKEIRLVEYGGGMRIVGFGGLLNGSARSRAAREAAFTRMHEWGYLDSEMAGGDGSGNGHRAPAKRSGRAKAGAGRSRKG